jgi:hypothetical protein
MPQDLAVLSFHQPLIQDSSNNFERLGQSVDELDLDLEY